MRRRRVCPRGSRPWLLTDAPPGLGYPGFRIDSQRPQGGQKVDPRDVATGPSRTRPEAVLVAWQALSPSLHEPREPSLLPLHHAMIDRRNVARLSRRGRHRERDRTVLHGDVPGSCPSRVSDTSRLVPDGTRQPAVLPGFARTHTSAFPESPSTTNAAPVGPRSTPAIFWTFPAISPGAGEESPARQRAAAGRPGLRAEVCDEPDRAVLARGSRPSSSSFGPGSCWNERTGSPT